METKKTGIQDVADLAGVSITTVSRVLNKHKSVSESNRKKVEEAIRSLKYSPSPYAQALASGKTNTIALIIPRYEGIFYSFYALELIRGIGTLCDVFKLDLLLHLTDGRNPFNFKSVAGVLFADIIQNYEQVESALNANIPTVIINNVVKDLEVSCVAIDNAGGAENAVEYLVGLGHKKIAHISGDMISQAAALRLEGYQRALEKNSLPENPEYIIKTDYSRGAARQAAEKLLTLSDPPTAIFAASDAMALEVIAVIMEKGKKVPDDISVVGFDDNPSSLYGAVSLTTVRQPLVQMAEDGLKKLNSLLKGQKEITKVTLPTKLIVRDSCKSIK